MHSVILNGTLRCRQCLLTPRWCICAAQADIRSPLAIDLLIHKRELFRPSSTGLLIERVCHDVRRHVWHPDQPFAAAAVPRPGRELWVLHPNGLPLPADSDPQQVQLVLLDGSWTETAAMAKSLAGLGRLVNLPLGGESRYWLRSKQDGGRYSTAEALLFVFRELGLAEAHAALHLQFELHVYASLRMRGYKQLALEFLADSPLQTALPDFLERFHTRRPL